MRNTSVSRFSPACCQKSEKLVARFVTKQLEWILGGITPVSDGNKKRPPMTFATRGLMHPGAPSAWLSLVGLRPRRARLRFTK